MTHQEVRLILQTALLGEIGSGLRAVAYQRGEDSLAIRFYFDGPISDDDRESAACVTTEVIAAMREGVRVSEELIRCDVPERIPADAALVFRRRDPRLDSTTDQRHPDADG